MNSYFCFDRFPVIIHLSIWGLALISSELLSNRHTIVLLKVTFARVKGDLHATVQIAIAGEAGARKSVCLVLICSRYLEKIRFVFPTTAFLAVVRENHRLIRVIYRVLKIFMAI